MIEKISCFELPDTIRKRGEIHPEATCENMLLYYTKINEIIDAVNKIESRIYGICEMLSKDKNRG